MELLTIYGVAAKQLMAKGIVPVAPMVGEFVTTQEMGGFSISLLTPSDDMLRWWCAPSDTPHFPKISVD